MPQNASTWPRDLPGGGRCRVTSSAIDETVRGEGSKLVSKLLSFQVEFRGVVKETRCFGFKNKTISHLQSLSPSKRSRCREGPWGVGL